MRLTLEESERALSVQELNEFQEKFNVELPTAFRQFYLKHNGGDLSESSSENDFLLGGSLRSNTDKPLSKRSIAT